MAEKCTWDPSKHGGKPCPIHSGGMWDENILTKKDKIEKLKAQGYSEEEIEEELKSVGFDDDYDSDFNEDVEYDDDYERSWGPKKDEDDLDEEREWTDEDIDAELGDDYAYDGMTNKEDILDLMINRNHIPEQRAKEWLDKNYDKWMEHDKKAQEQDELFSKLPNDIQSWLNRNDQLNVEIEAPSGDDTIYFKTTDRFTGDETQYSWNKRTGIADHTNNEHFGSIDDIKVSNSNENKSRKNDELEEASDKVEDLPKVSRCWVEDGKLNLYTNWNKSSKKSMDQFVDIRTQLKKMFGNNIEVKYKRDDTRDNGSETAGLIEVSFPNKESKGELPF